MTLALSASRRPHLILGCGYLGRRVAGLWRQQGRSVVAVTRSVNRSDEFRRDGLIPHVADICEPQTLCGLPDSDCVLFAVGYDRNSGKTQPEVFVDGLRNVLTEIGPRCRRFIYISSTSVYGQQDGSWVDETSPCEPVQPGGICCLAAEKLVRDFFAKPQAFCGSAVVLRLAGIYGPDRLLSRIADLKAGKPLSGRPDAWLNLIHVDDAAGAVIGATEWNGPRNGDQGFDVFLVCDDRPVQRGEYYSRLVQLIGAPPPQFDPALPSRRGSGELNKRCSNQRLKQELGLPLKYPTFETGLPASLGSPGSFSESRKG